MQATKKAVGPAFKSMAYQSMFDHVYTLAHPMKTVGNVTRTMFKVGSCKDDETTLVRGTGYGKSYGEKGVDYHFESNWTIPFEWGTYIKQATLWQFFKAWPGKEFRTTEQFVLECKDQKAVDEMIAHWETIKEGDYLQADGIERIHKWSDSWFDLLKIANLVQEEDRKKMNDSYKSSRPAMEASLAKHQKQFEDLQLEAAKTMNSNTE
ncbi:hypothetical protein FRC12_005406 [Ceratobasidium sp. 428]|nr:hypothetical protein FRC12_005406 [Ceratobasidium sp. 428]